MQGTRHLENIGGSRIGTVGLPYHRGCAGRPMPDRQHSYEGFRLSDSKDHNTSIYGTVRFFLVF